MYPAALNAAVIVVCAAWHINHVSHVFHVTDKYNACDLGKTQL